MPFRSTAQRGFMFAKHPDIAKRFAAETPKGAKLPAHVSPIHKMLSDHMSKKKGK